MKVCVSFALAVCISMPGAAWRPANAAGFKCDKAKSQTLVLKLARAKIIYEMGVIAGALNVTVDESTWSQIPFGTKESMAENVNCAIAGPNGSLRSILFLSYTSHKIVGEYSLGTLTVK